MIDMKKKYPEARELPRFASGEGDEAWREIVGTSHDDDVCGRFTYVADKLIAEDRFRERTLQAMHAIRERCYEKGGEYRYRLNPCNEIDAQRLAEVRHHLDGVGAYTVASFRELVPQPAWMEREQWEKAFRRYVDVLTGEDDPARRRRRPLNDMFGGVPIPDYRHFFLPARGVLNGHLVHQPLMGDLAELLALVGAIAAANHQDSFYRAHGYLMEALRTPPIIAAKEDGGFAIIHVGSH